MPGIPRIGLLPTVTPTPVVRPMFRSMAIAAGGLSAQRARIETIATNLANAETTRTADIVRVYPEADGAETPKWQYARALGELTGVPRGRTGIGVRLRGDRTAQAWARKHQQLRAALTNLVEERIPPEKAS